MGYLTLDYGFCGFSMFVLYCWVGLLYLFNFLVIYYDRLVYFQADLYIKFI